VESLISLKRDVKLDAKRDGERDVKRDGERDAKRDGERDAKRDGERDVKRDGERDVKRDVIGGEMSDIIEVKVRGAPNMEKECFFFLEEILGVIDQVTKSFLKLSKMVFFDKKLPDFSSEQKGLEKVNTS